MTNEVVIPGAESIASGLRPPSSATPAPRPVACLLCACSALPRAARTAAMGDPDDGWHTVMPTSQSGMERLTRSQLEECERQILREWESSRSHWSGM